MLNPVNLFKDVYIKLVSPGINLGHPVVPLPGLLQALPSWFPNSDGLQPPAAEHSIERPEVV